jgi:ABC-type transport system involved in multi-copper enzyme maturation permease subunit
VPDPHDRRSALALSDAGGHGRVARVGLASAIVGQLIIAAAEVIWPSNRDLGDVLFSVSPILTGAGLVTAGVAIICAGVWARPSRFLPLTLGLYTILVLTPVMIASGGPPAPLALWTIGGWDMLWFVLSASLLRFTPAPFRATRQWQRSPVLPDRTSAHRHE